MKKNLDIKLVMIIVLSLILGVMSGLYFGASSKEKVRTPQFVSSEDNKNAKDYKSKSVFPIFVENAKDIQTCYLDHLKETPKVSEGKINVVFKINEDGSVSDSKVVKNEFDNEKIGICLTDKIERYYFPPPPYGMNPYMNHSFSFVSEKTAEAEAEKKRLNNTLPKILPNN